AAWRRHGVQLGVEHAGASMRGLSRLAGLGLDHVKIESRFVRGATSEAAVRVFATGLVDLLHGMRLRAVAEGIADKADLQALWDLGFDAATGPAVKLA
ncbi:MAG: EAL domain-containing protein, partial [Rubrivivax sp.]